MNNMDKPIVKLIGNNGNAFAIIGACIEAAKKEGWSDEKICGLIEDMMSGDYNHVLNIAADHFEVE